jgi:hypothetical protein
MGLAARQDAATPDSRIARIGVIQQRRTGS